MEKNELTVSQIQDAKDKINEIVRLRFHKTTTVSSTMNFTVFFSEDKTTVLNGNCHSILNDPCIEFDVVYHYNNIDFRQNRFYNFSN